jgi:hypothetical protein
MNDPNLEKDPSNQNGLTKSIKETLNRIIPIKDPRSKKKAVYVLAAACIFGLVASGILLLMSHLSDNGYSELYFDDPDSLPRVIYVGQGINFSFGLTSHEKTPFIYKFNAAFNGSLIKSGVVRLNPDEGIKVNVTLMPNASSIAHFKTSRVAQFRVELDDSNNPVHLNVSWTPKSSMTFISPEPGSLNIRSLNSTEAIIVGSQDSIKPGNFDNMSTFGYVLQKGQCFFTEENNQRYLDYKFTENEYRYKFLNISVGVVSQNEQLKGSSDQLSADGAPHSYEIHFRAIVVEDIPEKNYE